MAKVPTKKTKKTKEQKLQEKVKAQPKSKATTKPKAKAKAKAKATTKPKAKTTTKSRTKATPRTLTNTKTYAQEKNAVSKSPKKPVKTSANLMPRGFPIVALGASAGGLEAFEAFFQAMPHDSGIAFVLVAHLDRTHVSLLPELIQKHSQMKVRQVRDGMKVQPNHVYVIPPNKALVILNGVLQLMELTQPRSANLPIDIFFRSLAKDQGSNAICAILSGTGTDGTLGLKAIKGEVGMVMVQDEDSAKYDGMPRSAIATGLADYVLAPSLMPAQLIKYTKHAFNKRTLAAAKKSKAVPNALQKIYIILRAQTDHDFSLYKENTIYRRIERRMNVQQIDDIEDYAVYLQGSEREVGILFKELLIGVTNFFRDSAAFDALRENYIYNMLKNKPDGYTIRVWVAGCSSGEEAYSLAIILQECMLEMKSHFNVQIFGTDIDEDAINIARAGIYPESIAADVSPDRLQRYFTKEDDGQYCIKKSIREMLVFAPQDINKDPPFTKLDILCCRNLLIYLGPELQKRLFPVFHYSLKTDGILFLGSSESVGQTSKLFSVLDKKWKIYALKTSSKNAPPLLNFQQPDVSFDQPDLQVPENIRKAEEISALQLVETILQQSNASPCAIIDDDSNVIYIHGRTGKFLETPEGKISVNILEMARGSLKSSLAKAIRKVATIKQGVSIRNMRIEEDDGDDCYLDLFVKPVLEQSVVRGLMMVVFEEKTKPSSKSANVMKVQTVKAKGITIQELNRELQYTKENLQTTIEELETSNEELKSTNEELQSTNEELQSTNEEMETSKEELQSLNEESATVNAELQSRIDELSNINDDMKNLLDSTNIATLFLDKELRIRRFTPKTTEIIPLAGTDLGRPVSHFATSLIDADLEMTGRKVLEDLAVREVEVKSRKGEIYNMKVRPYRTVANVIDGVVMTFEDISKRKKAESLFRESEKRTLAWLEQSPICSKIVDLNGNLQYMSRAGKEALGLDNLEDYYGQPYPFKFYPILYKKNIAKHFALAKKTLKPTNLEAAVIDINGRELWFDTTIVPVTDDGQLEYYLLVSVDISDRVAAERALGKRE